MNRRLVGVDVGARPPRRCCSLGTRCTHPDPCWVARACSLWSTRYPAMQGMIVRNTTGRFVHWRSLPRRVPTINLAPARRAYILAPGALGWGAVIVIDSDNTAPARPVKPVPAGRPALGTDKRTRRVNLSVNERELEALRALAEREGATSLSRWVRDRVLASLDERASTGDVAREIARLRADLNRVGNNVNQVAHVLNAANLWRAAPPEDLRVLESVEEVRRVLGDIRAWTSEHS